MIRSTITKPSASKRRHLLLGELERGTLGQRHDTSLPLRPVADSAVVLGSRRIDDRPRPRRGGRRRSARRTTVRTGRAPPCSPRTVRPPRGGCGAATARPRVERPSCGCDDRRRGLEVVLDAPQRGAEEHGQAEVRARVSAGDPELESAVGPGRGRRAARSCSSPDPRWRWTAPSCRDRSGGRSWARAPP